jgi:hypothetical protein
MPWAPPGCVHVRVQCLCAVLGVLIWVGDAALRLGPWDEKTFPKISRENRPLRTLF